jgi:F-type H+-transporting ATPase subunit epsilon
VKAFTLQLQGATDSAQIEGLTSFVAEDASGSFGILAGHARVMTSLVIGLARFRIGEEPWQYLALPGALLYFHDNLLTLSTRRYLLDDDYMRISTALQEQILKEEENLHAMKESLHHMEEKVFECLWKLGREGAE